MPTHFFSHIEKGFLNTSFKLLTKSDIVIGEYLLCGTFGDTATSTATPSGYWKMLEDKEGKLTFQQVIRSPVADDFHLNQSKDNHPNSII